MNDSALRLASDAEAVFRAGLSRVDPAAMVRQALRVGPPAPGRGGRGELVVRTELEEARYPLDAFDRVLVAGMGKAGASMARGLEEALGDRIAGGVVAVKEGHLERLTRIRLVEASHPVPDERSRAAAEEVLGLGRGVDERTLVVVLISGGGSALLCAPRRGSPSRTRPRRRSSSSPPGRRSRRSTACASTSRR